MKKNYIVSGFEKTVCEKFESASYELILKFKSRLEILKKENSNAAPEKKYHLEGQVLPGIAAYEILQSVMSKEEALKTVHSYVEEKAYKFREKMVKLLYIPGLYRMVPYFFTKGTKKLFNEKAGFSAVEHKTSEGVWRIDMVKCPYNDNCIRYGCPELCGCFCDSDDITYDNMHKNIIWHRTKTLGRGGDCCDFCVKLKN